MDVWGSRQHQDLRGIFVSAFQQERQSLLASRLYMTMFS
jgi:hypothetical protein